MSLGGTAGLVAPVTEMGGLGPLDTCPVRISWGAAEVRFPFTAASRSPPGGNGFFRDPQGSLNPAAATWSALGAAVELGVWVAANPLPAPNPDPGPGHCVLLAKESCRMGWEGN